MKDETLAFILCCFGIATVISSVAVPICVFNSIESNNKAFVECQKTHPPKECMK